ncbi:MAG: Gfo/Idh/MocA family oxidoreductase [Fimbriimonadaceae bacterium]|nr:Gfo/Idh/MocA family oxidoreductase [Fimbriimonadaceae bacterium]
MALGWGISGTGDIIRKAVAPAICAHDGSRLVSFYSRTAARATQLASDFGACRATADFDALLSDPQVDIVYVGGEVARHAPETIAAAAAGKHVLVEKPMALTAAEGRQMIEACAHAGVQLAVAYYRRYYPLAQRLQGLVAEGAIGTPLQATIDMASYYNPAPDDPKYWRVAAAGGGGALQDIGSHRLDVLCWLLGEPAQVAGFTGHRVLDYQAPDTETLLARFVNGTHATCRCTWGAGANVDTFCVTGSAGALQVGAFEDPSFVLRRRGQPDQVIEVPAVAANRHFPLIEDVATRLLAGQAVRHDGRAGWQATRLIDGCYRSQASGLVIAV